MIHITDTIIDTRAQKMVSHAVAHCRIGVSTWPILRGAKHFNSTSYFLCLVCTHCPHIFLLHKMLQCWWDANTETIPQQILQLSSIIQEHWIIEEKWRFVKSIWHLKRLNKKVDEDAHRIKNRYKLFVSRASKVLTQWLTWLGWTHISGYVMHNSVSIVISST